MDIDLLLIFFKNKTKISNVRLPIVLSLDPTKLSLLDSQLWIDVYFRYFLRVKLKFSNESFRCSSWTQNFFQVFLRFSFFCVYDMYYPVAMPQVLEEGASY